MKKLFLSSSLFFVAFIFILSPIIFAQGGQTPEAYLGLAQSYEKVKSYKLSGDNYMLAGKAFEVKAKEYTTDVSIKTNLKAARDAYAKAKDNYKNAMEPEMEKDALQQAVRVGILLGQKVAEEKKNSNDDTKAAIKQISTKPGKEIFMNARMGIFSITPPDALKYIGPRVFTKANHVMLRESETFIQVNGTNTDGIFQISLKEYIGGKGTITIQESCEGQQKNIKESGGVPFLGNYQVRLVSIGAETKACLSTHESQQIDTRKYRFGFDMVFDYKNNSYGLSGSVPYAWKDAVLEMLKTFHIVGETPEPKLCDPSEVYLLENLAFEKAYKLPDENKDVRIIIEPYLARNKVSDGWHLITQTIIEALSAYQEIGDKFDLLVNGKKALYGNPGEFKDFVKLEIVMRSLNLPDVSPTNVIQGYIEVFDKTITALSGLENKISNMTMNLSWEVPYVNFTTKCIPRFICMNGKMEPDRKNLTYRLVSKGTQTDKQVYQNLTHNQAVEKREKVLNRFLNELKKDAEAYTKASDCSDFTNKLINVKFPVAPDECTRRQTELTRLEAEQKSLEAQKINLVKRINSHNATRQARIDERNKQIASNEKSLAQKRITRNQKEELRRNYENSTAPNKAALILQVSEQINVLNIQIGNLMSETTRLEWERNDLVDNKFEKELNLEIQTIDERLKKLKEELASARDELNKCR